MITSSVDRVLADLASLKKEPRLTSQMKDQIQKLQVELEFLKMFLWCLRRNSLRKHYITATVGKGKLGFYRIGVLALDRGKFEDWDFAASKLMQKIVHCKPKMEENIQHLSDCSFPSQFSSPYMLRELVISTHRNLKNLLRLKADRIAALKMQLRALIKKLEVVRHFLNFGANQCISSIFLDVWAYKTACLLLMYWLDPMKEAMPVKENDILYELLQKVNFYISEVAGIYLRVLKAAELSLFNRFEIVIIVEGFLNVLLPIRCMKILQERLMFLITFLMFPPESKRHSKDGNLILTKAHAVAGEIPSLFCSLTEGELKEDIAKQKNVLLAEFQEKIDTVKAEVREHYIKIPVPSRSNFPRTNALRFIDLLLKNLANLKDTIKSKANFLSCTKHQIVILCKELLSLWPFLKDTQEKQNVFEEPIDLWKRIIDVTYQVEHIIDSCQIEDVPIWYNMIRLSDVIEEIKFIKTEIQDIRDKQEYSIEVINATKDSRSIHLVQADTSRLDEVVVGFEDEAKKVIDRLIRGSRKLDIVSIVGMPGQGKTTLAKKIYNNPSIRYYFNKCAWCFVTQVYGGRQLLLDILREITVLDSKLENMSQEDLAHELCKCLRGKRYLIVVDDIWDIRAWEALRESFPDDHNGSRILFTSRNEMVELQEEFGCHPHRLRSLSEDESLALLNVKLFPEDGCCPSEFAYDVKPILGICNGLPLAVVVIAGLLKRASNDMDQLRQIVKNLTSQLASEECMDILELSYKNLPDSLKPCFLSLATVAKRKAFNVQKLIEVWIAEGFIEGTKTERLNDVAMEYMVDLISRSLVIVTKRSSRGEIKECQIHDLVRELCVARAKEEKFINFPDIQSYSSNAEPCRICITEKSETYIRSKPSTTYVRSLFNSYNDSVDWWLRGFSFGVDHLAFLFAKLKFLRVLDMEGNALHRDSLDEIASLIFLRYLAVKCDVNVLPLSIGNLCNLETLRLARGAADTFWFPHTFWRMKRLRNVHIQGSVRISFDDYEMEDSSELRNLDSLSSICICNVDEAKRVLKRLPSVRKLRLKFPVSWLWGWNINLFDVLNSLRMLESLSLYYDRFGFAHPSCLLNFPSTLKKLTLYKSRLPWSKMSAISKLPNLEALKLLCDAFYGPQWDVEDDEFLSLKFLKLCGLTFSEWNASIDSFRCLERLLVVDCKILKEIPCTFGEITTLKRIYIDWCTEDVSTSAWSIQKEQQEMGNNDLEVVITNIYHTPSYNRHSELFKSHGWGPEANLGNLLLEGLKTLNAVLSVQPRYSYGMLECFQLPIPFFGNIFLGEQTKRTAICNCKPEKQVQKTQHEYMRRVNNMHKYNCQSRQAILNRHFRDLLKRDG